MMNIDKKVMLPIIIFLFVALTSGGVILTIKLISNSPKEIIISQAAHSSDNVEVNISGAIINPGIYPLKSNDTFASIIEFAGLTGDADPNSISIFVHSNNETLEPQKININTAEAWLLEALPDIGPSRADDIITYRETNGPFKSIDDLMKIKGIGQSTFNKLKDKVTVED